MRADGRQEAGDAVDQFVAEQPKLLGGQFESGGAQSQLLVRGSDMFIHRNPSNRSVSTFRPPLTAL
jgi:hypothetical protein